MKVRSTIFSLLILLGGISVSLSASAGVFDLFYYLDEGEGAIGAEPQFTFSRPAGVEGTLYYSHGMSELIKIGGFVGTGGGKRGFRIGGRASFDFFPDTSGQPGLGVGVEAMQSQFLNAGQFQLQFVPYLYKSFLSEGTEHEFAPFFSFPIGVAFQNGQTTPLFSIVMGCQFRETETFSFLFEVGVAVNNTDTYFSGGVVFYHQ